MPKPRRQKIQERLRLELPHDQQHLASEMPSAPGPRIGDALDKTDSASQAPPTDAEHLKTRDVCVAVLASSWELVHRCGYTLAATARRTSGEALIDGALELNAISDWVFAVAMRVEAGTPVWELEWRGALLQLLDAKERLPEDVSEELRELFALFYRSQRRSHYWVQQIQHATGKTIEELVRGSMSPTSFRAWRDKGLQPPEHKWRALIERLQQLLPVDKQPLARQVPLIPACLLAETD